MSRTFFVTVTSLLLLASDVSADARRPNILIIVGDDMGYADIGVHGCKDIPTPHIDSIAKNGIRCTSGYVSGPYCSPTRAGLMTGRYQQRFGHEFNPGPNPVQAFGLPLTEVTLADKLKAAGYATGMVGKWHLGNDPKFNPVNRGFQEYFGFLGGAHQYFPQRNPAKVASAAVFRGLERVEEKEYLTDAFAREATAYIDKHQKEPFFLYLTFNAVHNPMQAADKYLARFPDVKDEKRRTYCAMMSAMDDAIGSVLKKLDDTQLTENTLVFFISDNGGPPVNASSNGPLRGFKAQTWEGGIRVPYLVQWKGKLPAGKTYDQPVIQLDLHSTALAAAGLVRAVKEQTGPPLDGVDLLPHLAGETSTLPHDALYWRFGEQTAIRSGNHKLVKARGGSGDWELYDLVADLGETKNLAADKPDLAKELLAKYDAWNAGNVKPLWGAPAAGGKGKAGLKKLQEKEE
ncbi:MAG: sulfatase [Pirellulaceae bacterium]